MVAFLGFRPFHLGLLRQREINRLRQRGRLLNGLQDQRVQHELVGVKPLGAPAVDATQELFYLMLKHGDFLLGGLELLGEGLDLKFFFFDDLVGFDDRGNHGCDK